MQHQLTGLQPIVRKFTETLIKKPVVKSSPAIAKAKPDSKDNPPAKTSTKTTLPI